MIHLKKLLSMLRQTTVLVRTFSMTEEHSDETGSFSAIVVATNLGRSRVRLTGGKSEPENGSTQEIIEGKFVDSLAQANL
jgi:hypothetical protein